MMDLDGGNFGECLGLDEVTRVGTTMGLGTLREETREPSLLSQTSHHVRMQQTDGRLNCEKSMSI